jgi:DNA-binding transcriptional MerR regulator
MNDRELTIQELSDSSGISRRNIYFYTQQGILPPPEGAGLAARYSEIHLLRLKAIPILRSQGLRLDDIRQRLKGESLDGLRQIVAPRDDIRSQQVLIGQQGRLATPAADALPVRAMKQYELPGGVTITAPAVMTSPERRRFTRFLQAAKAIYYAPQVPQDGGKE